MVDDREHKLYKLADKIIALGSFHSILTASPHGEQVRRRLKEGKKITGDLLPGRMINDRNFSKEELKLMKELKQKHFNGRIN